MRYQARNQIKVEAVRRQQGAGASVRAAGQQLQ
jgi:hypothetical protein